MNAATFMAGDLFEELVALGVDASLEHEAGRLVAKVTKTPLSIDEMIEIVAIAQRHGAARVATGGYGIAFLAAPEPTPPA